VSAAANAAAFLSMRRRLPEQGAPLQPHVPGERPRPRPLRVAAVDPQEVRVSYRKRRWSPD